MNSDSVSNNGLPRGLPVHFEGSTVEPQRNSTPTFFNVNPEVAPSEVQKKTSYVAEVRFKNRDVTETTLNGKTFTDWFAVVSSSQFKDLYQRLVQAEIKAQIRNRIYKQRNSTVVECLKNLREGFQQFISRSHTKSKKY